MKEFLTITKALSDESRVRALLAVKDGELCLCQIIEVLGLSPATVSRHVNMLHQAGLLDRRKQGKFHFYRLAGKDGSPAARGALGWLLRTLEGTPPVLNDARRIRQVRRQDLEELSACYRT